MSQTATLEPRVVDALHGHFFVPGYQRGYRWGRHEVEHLLNDIAESEGTYYLQPIVVKEVEGGWELVDGQQRLTTLFLILRYLRSYLPQLTVNYSLEYETRPLSAAYLEEPVEDRSQENIDFFHIFEASVCIKAWFESRTNPTLAAVEFYEALCKRVNVIWYEAPAESDSRTLFTRLNVGRIPLTDAELVKATLLSRVTRPEEVAAQWDAIERDLRIPEFWSFITGQGSGVPTHISLLLDTLAGGPTGRARPLFYTFERLRARIAIEPPDDVWNDVVDLHALLLGWYEDRALFHKIGFLVADGVVFRSLVEPARTLTRTQLHEHLDGMIRERLNLSLESLAELSYEGDWARCERVLTLVNVETVRRRRHSTERYSFAAHASRSWSLEHIDAQSAEPLTKADQWSEWLRLHRAALAALPHLKDAEREKLLDQIDAALEDISEHRFRQLEPQLINAFRIPGGEPADYVHQLSNLALLATGDNSALSNACFEVKRQQILALDRDGRYIPACTRNVFLKYYTSAEAQQIHFWGPQDRNGYMSAIVEAVGPYLKTEGPVDD
jgi:hypothetical protein